MSFILPQSEFNLGQHSTKRAVISCIDFRFQDADIKFINSFSAEAFDHIKIPGAGKNFVTDTPLRSALVNSIEKVCIGLHGVTELLILNHWDCGAYGGSKNFKSPEAEKEAHEKDLRAAKDFLHEKFPQLKISAGYSRYTDKGLKYSLL